MNAVKSNHAAIPVGVPLSILNSIPDESPPGHMLKVPKEFPGGTRRGYREVPSH